MKRFNELTAADIQAYLSRGWLTHDGMWLFNAYQKIGIEKGNELNRAAIKSMAQMEMKRTREILQYEKQPADIGEMEMFLKAALELLLPPEVRDCFSVSVAGPSTIRWHWDKESCFAFKGIKRINMLDHYQCGVIYRIECWIETLGYRREVNPRIDGCLMKNDGMCSGDITIFFQE